MGMDSTTLVVSPRLKVCTSELQKQLLYGSDSSKI